MIRPVLLEVNDRALTIVPDSASGVVATSKPLQKIPVINASASASGKALVKATGRDFKPVKEENLEHKQFFDTWPKLKESNRIGEYPLDSYFPSFRNY